jgi:hypothetical protein
VLEGKEFRKLVGGLQKELIVKGDEDYEEPTGNKPPKMREIVGDIKKF